MLTVSKSKCPPSYIINIYFLNIKIPVDNVVLHHKSRLDHFSRDLFSSVLCGGKGKEKESIKSTHIYNCHGPTVIFSVLLPLYEPECHHTSAPDKVRMVNISQVFSLDEEEHQSSAINLQET